jgi:uncharacterized membrane protein
MKSKDISSVMIFASLYAALVYVFAPFSFYFMQFRVAGILRPAIAKKWLLSAGYAVGILLGNLISPIAGVYELIFMPVMGFISGLLGYTIAKKFGENYFVAGVSIATVISISLSWMFYQVYNLSTLATLPYLFISEQTVCFLGACVLKAIETRYELWK